MTGAGQTARLSATRLACMRGGRLLFEGLDLVLEAGGAALVRGPNGAGKSSLLRVLAGLLAPAAGTISITGGIALAAEAAALDRERGLAGALGFWAALDRAPAGRLAAALDAMALAPLADVPVRMLSTGQRKRATLARVIAGDTAVWLLDEPANGLDGESCDRLSGAIERHRAAGGIAVVASHQPLALPGAIEVML